MVFVVGVRRSGTNLLGRIIGAHPDAYLIPGETYLFLHGVAPLGNLVQHGLAGSAQTGSLFVDRGDYLDAVRDLCDRLFSSAMQTLDAPVALLVERTPDHLRVLDLIGAVYPDAAVVHIIRDGRDVARSLVNQGWGPQAYEEAAEEWRSGIEQARAAAPTLGRYLEVRYEDLVEDPEQGVRVVYQHLGLSEDTAVVQRALAEAAVPFNVDLMAKQVRGERGPATLTPSALRSVEGVAGSLLEELGYTPLSTPGPRARDHAMASRRGDGSRARQLLAGLPWKRYRDQRVLNRAIVARFDATLALVDALLSDFSAGRVEGLHQHFGPMARIRVVAETGTWDGRGPEAVARLSAQWSRDPALAGRQVRGDVHPGVPSFTVVTSWRTAEGIHHRTMVLTRFADRIGELTWYVGPGPAGDPDGPGGSVPA